MCCFRELSLETLRYLLFKTYVPDELFSIVVCSVVLLMYLHYLNSSDDRYVSEFYDRRIDCVKNIFQSVI